MLNPFAMWRAWIDSLPDWAPDPPDDNELADCELECECIDLHKYELVDLQKDAARSDVVYKNGKHKRSRYRPEKKIDKMTIVAVIHQMGVVRRESSTRWRFVTANEVISAMGTAFKLHPLGVRLTASNRFNRSPYLVYNFELAGNFEGVDGEGNWWAPDRFGRSRPTNAQLKTLDRRIRALKMEAEMLGADLHLVAPHRVAGFTFRGGRKVPNRPLCPGSRANSAAERFATELGVAVPSDTYSLGGLTIPKSWRYYRIGDPAVTYAEPFKERIASITALSGRAA